MSSVDDLQNDEYRSSLLGAIAKAQADGLTSVSAIALRCEGANLEFIHRLLVEAGLDQSSRESLAAQAAAKMRVARRRASNLLARLPAPDPERAQWWFSLDTIIALGRAVSEVAVSGSVVMVGVPSLAEFYASRYGAKVHLLDVDSDVIRATSNLPGHASIGLECLEYDVSNSVPDIGRFQVCVMDPPWYPVEFEYFITRAAELLMPGGRLFLTFPSRLTRPSIPQELRKVCDFACKQGLDLVRHDAASLKYRIPDFERAAFSEVDAAVEDEWRVGDLQVFERSTRDPEGLLPAWEAPQVETYSKNATELRLFLAPEKVSVDCRQPIKRVLEYSATVSRRIPQRSLVALWSSNKLGFQVRNADAARIALGLWSTSSSRETAFKNLEPGQDEAREILEALYAHIDLPADTRDIRRTPLALRDANQMVLSAHATRTSSRPKSEDDDDYRLPFARDRDRVVWSNGLRCLAHKTQVFSAGASDLVRQRLAHSIEVSQLASTIGASFGLDRDLIEAGALAHDIGHTPFGHAGEHAMDSVLNRISPNIGGFNHYEHGVDVVRWLEDAYRSPAEGGTYGLNLTAAVCECIFKHTFCQSGHRVGQRELWAKSKYRETWPALVGDRPCHLEGQAVRLADKVSYLISDIEDGLRVGALTVRDLRSCRFFARPPIDLESTSPEEEIERFLSERRVVLNVLMEDAINATAQRLGRKSLRANEYVVDHSPRVREELTEIWHRLQAGKLHRDSRVVAANFRASSIVSSLLVLFAVQPTLIDATFRRAHEQLAGTDYISWYEKKALHRVTIPDSLTHGLKLDHVIGIETPEPIGSKRVQSGWEIQTATLVMAKDFVASLSDVRARKLHETLIFRSE